MSAVGLTKATRWLDARGREWMIVEKYPGGRNLCTTTDRRYQGEWSHRDIRIALNNIRAATGSELYKDNMP